MPDSTVDTSPFFDKDENWESWRCKLPHREQQLKIQFVTFRLADSLPQSVLNDYRKRREAFLKQFPKPWDKSTEILYEKQFTSVMDHYLDNGYGSCVLANPSVREIVVNSLNCFEGERYHLLAYVIMPNHVHMLILPFEGISLKNIMSSLKKFTATAINRLKGTSGKFWDEDYFDVLVRSYNHYSGRLEYIKNNPRFLPLGTYSLGGIDI